MTPGDVFNMAGTAVSVVAALVLIRAAWQLNTTQVWKGEAEAQKARADRLEATLKEINARLTKIEAENKTLVELLTALKSTQAKG